ncbi:cbb3-type cytochrome oxidase subunit 3 [Kangiella sp.]|uniref:cbb3-type cytochrome oxidase subunit 3 n=1 Tax=Kangiella sp. TaxID=1920245 RepID=UPI003A92EB28
MDINIFRGVMTLIIMLLFIGLCIWVYSKKRKPMYEDAARMALDDDDKESSAKNGKKAVTHE